MLGLLTRRSPPAAPPAIRLPRRLAPSREVFSLDRPLIAFSRFDAYTVRQAVEGTAILGGTGAAKTSSSGRMLATAFLRANFGGLVLCAKPEERALWERYARETGRSASVVVFDGSGRHGFDPLDYEARRGGPFVARNLVELVMTLAEAARGGEGAGGGDNQIWTDLTKELLSNAFTLLFSAWGRVRLADLMKLIDTAPQTVEQSNDPAWQAGSFCFRTIVRMLSEPAHRLPPPDEETIGDFFRIRWAQRHSKMRSSIEANLSASISPFLTGTMRELFCTKTTVVPEMAHQGAILIIDLPVKSHGSAGILAQHIWKYMFQQATERRPNSPHPTTRPVFIWADECQFFVSSYDREFQSTARSSKACTVYITQNLPTFYTAMKGPNARDTVSALLGNFQTKIFHQNTDVETNKYGSDIINKQWQWVSNVGSNAGTSTNEGVSRGSSGGSSSSSTDGGRGSSFSSTGGWNKARNSGSGRSTGSSTGVAEQLHEELLPSTFLSLRKGGLRLPPEAIVIQGGTPFNLTGRNWLRCQFPQR